MSSTLKKYLNVLEFISNIKDKKVREGVLKQYSFVEDFYLALHEIAVNTVNKNIPLSEKDKKCLKPFKKSILNLARKNKSKRLKRRKINQSGGFLPYLIPLILNLIK